MSDKLPGKAGLSSTEKLTAPAGPIVKFEYPNADEISVDQVVIFAVFGSFVEYVKVGSRTVFDGAVFLSPYDVHSSYELKKPLTWVFYVRPSSPNCVDAVEVITVKLQSQDVFDRKVRFHPNPSYPDLAPGLSIGRLSTSSMTGEYKEGVLSGVNGAVFFSPSLTVPNPSNVVDIGYSEVATPAYDSYVSLKNSDPPQQRPFLMGPPPSVPSGRVYPPDITSPGFIPVPNSNYTLMGTKQNSVKGSMFDSITLKTTIIFY